MLMPLFVYKLIKVVLVTLVFRKLNCLSKLRGFRILLMSEKIYRGNLFASLQPGA